MLKLMPQDKVRKSLKYSVLDGAFFSAMVGFGESFFAAFAVFLKATSVQIGILDALPKTLGSISQLLSNWLIRSLKSRKKLVAAGAFIEGLFYIPIALVYFFGELKIYYLIAFVSIYWILGTIITPAWTSWIGDLTDGVNRGNYFGRRNKVAGVVSLASLFAAGYILQHFREKEYIGFVIIFSIALIARMMSFYYLTKKFEPEFRIEKEEIGLLGFLSEARKTQFGIFSIFMALMNFSVYFTAPFFAPYLLRDAKLDYFSFTAVIGIGMLAKLLSMPVWGKAADRWGNRKILALSAFTMPIVPLLFVFSMNLGWLVAVQIYSGIVWAGFELAGFNFILDTTTQRSRATLVAYYNVLNGVAILVGALIAGMIIKHNSLFSSSFYLVFIISFFLRVLVSASFVPLLKEKRRVEDIAYYKLFFRIMTKLPPMDALYSIAVFPAKRLAKSFDHTRRLAEGKVPFIRRRK